VLDDDKDSKEGKMTSTFFQPRKKNSKELKKIQGLTKLL
jgi:hypothetical protein